MFDIRENLKKLPDCPGVYLHKDRLGNVIYVGKAISLRNRVRQYFQSSRNLDPKVRSMVDQIAEFEYIKAGSEVEALILECNLIKKYRPKYNILLRDDKTYPYIKVTKEEWPRVVKTRNVDRDDGRYFGPYSDAGAVNRIVDLLNNSFALKRCSATAFPAGFRPCLNYHIRQCRGICAGEADRREYDEAVEGAVEFLSGRSKRLQTELKRKMQAAAEAMNYEEAAVYRDYLAAAEALAETQRVVMHRGEEADVLIPVRGEEDVYMAVFFVREGKLVGRETFEMEMPDGEDADGPLISAFVNQHYSRLPEMPKEILLPCDLEDGEALEAFLSERAGRRVRIHCPQRGEKRALVEMATRDASEMMRTVDERARSARQRREDLGREIYSVLAAMGQTPADSLDPETGKAGYDGREFRTEAYDISHTNGVDTVGAMVAFQGLKPDKKSYRKFRIRYAGGQDDYAAMEEVLSRRFTRMFQGDESFAVLPDIIFMDGGKGHVTTALKVIDAAQLPIPVVGMVKDDRHRTRALIFRREHEGAGPREHEATDAREHEEFLEIPLADKPLLFSYIGRIQEEVHRFAIDYHRKLRGKHAKGSVLDEIPGIGPTRRNALLNQFKSVEEIRRIALSEDGEEQLAAADHMDARAAGSVCRWFQSQAAGPPEGGPAEPAGEAGIDSPGEK